MTSNTAVRPDDQHSHEFLGAAHARNERKAWAVIGICTFMMVLESRAALRSARWR